MLILYEATPNMSNQFSFSVIEVGNLIDLIHKQHSQKRGNYGNVTGGAAKSVDIMRDVGCLTFARAINI